MVKFIVKRFLIMMVMLAALSFVVFVIIELPPGDFADRAVYRLKASGVTVTQQEIIDIRHQLGLDRPFLQRYFLWISNIVLHGNWGISMLRRLPVTDVIGERLGFTAILAISTLIFTYGLAIPIGICRCAAVFAGRLLLHAHRLHRHGHAQFPFGLSAGVCQRRRLWHQRGRPLLPRICRGALEPRPRL
jgi:ABC-type dipeptide/oligopeptide/nickel transport system permease component